MRVICFHTGGEYSAAAARLAESGQRFGVPVTVYARPDAGSWWANVSYKPSIIAKTLAADPEPVLHVDADCEILDDLSALPAMLGGNDILMRHRPGSLEPYNSGVMLLANNRKVRNFVDGWGEAVVRLAHRFETGDQGVLAKCLPDSHLHLGNLPTEYNALPSDTCDMPKILHRKASRDNPALGAWKETRRLETALTRRTEALLAGGNGTRTAILWGGDRPPLESPGDNDVHFIDRCGGATPFASWFSTASAAVAAQTSTKTARILLATDNSDGNAAEYFRGKLSPKPTSLALPEKMHLYYPSFDLVTRFETHRELQGASPWLAAVNACAVRGAHDIVASCPPGLRPVLGDACRAAKIKLTLV